MRHRCWPVSAVAPGSLLVAWALLAACGGGGATPSSTPAPTASAEPTATLIPVRSIRDVDFATRELAGELIRVAGGGEVDGARVLFGELIRGTGEQAIVIVDSGGTAGEIGAGVYRLVEGRPIRAQFIRYAGRIELRQELIVTLEGVYESGDAECCPSKLREVAYQWNGSTFAVITDQVVANPSR